jgi:UDP-N-acetylmuramate--alanine ligase
VVAAAGREVVGYSVADAGADYFAEAIDASPRGTSFDVIRGGKRLGRADLGLPGLHNVSNALGALAVAIEAGLESAVCCRALGEFVGVERRLTVRGESGGVMVVDDYAHHPTEVRATLGVGRAWADERGGRLICVFQPHRYTRTAKMGREFGPAFAVADHVVVTDVYAAGERPIEGVTGEIVAASAIEAGHASTRYVADAGATAALLAPELVAGDVVMTLGAGDIWQAGDQLCEHLECRTAGKAG